MIVKSSAELPAMMPTHLDLPDRDGAIVENSLELPQSILLVEAMRPWLHERVHPDGQFYIGADTGIYWRWEKEEPLAGCKSPDWYYVPGVPPLRDGEIRRSYVLWQEQVSPLIVIEYVSRDGKEEHDATPSTGKFWVYEQRIQAEYYIIYDTFHDKKIDAFQRVNGRYQPMKPNERGHYPIPSMLAELGLWEGTFQDCSVTWLRWFDLDGNMLPVGEECAEQEKQRADQETQRAKNEKLRANKEKQRANKEKQRAEQEKQRADQLAARLRALGEDPEEQ